MRVVSTQYKEFTTFPLYTLMVTDHIETGF
jgi:hypothetical protein